MSPHAKFWVLCGVAGLVLMWVLLIPMPVLLVAGLLLVLLCLTLILVHIQLIALHVRGAVLPVRWQRRLRRVQRHGWPLWVLRLVVLGGAGWFAARRAYTAAALLILVMVLIGFAKPLVRLHLAKWTAP